MVDISYPTPGRGAWTQTGGLLPAKPGASGRAGYYRLAVSGETPIGSVYASGKDGSHDPYVVHLGVKAIQRLSGMSGTDVDGWFGPQTAARVIAAQKTWGVEADGIVGRATMKAALRPLIGEIAAHSRVPAPLLGGLLVNESGLDPAAVGVNGIDHGLAQINLAAHAARVTVEMALDEGFALTFTTEDLAHTYEVWVGRTKADPWDVAIANHNSPRLAKIWATTGQPPFVPDRVLQIEDYVRRVRESWD